MILRLLLIIFLIFVTYRLIRFIMFINKAASDMKNQFRKKENHQDNIRNGGKRGSRGKVIELSEDEYEVK